MTAFARRPPSAFTHCSNEWQATKTKLVESKPEKPEEKPKQSKAAAATALEVWEKEVAKIDREVSEARSAASGLLRPSVEC